MSDVRTIDDRINSRKVRDWAHANGHGHEVGDRGRIPKRLVSMYQAATAGEPVDDDEPDWSQAGDGGEADALAAMEQELAAEAQAQPPAGDTRPQTPPVTSLDEARERLGAAPKSPAWAKQQRTRSTPAGKQKTIPVTRAVRDDKTGKLALLLSIPVSGIQTVDPYCGTALADNLDNIVQKMVPLMCLSQDVIRFFQNATVFMMMIALAVAVQPVAIAVGKHHVMHSVNEFGQPVDEHGNVRKQQDENPEPEQADWSLYTTQVTGHIPAAETARHDPVADMRERQAAGEPVHPSS
jgi:hypothetical protein